MTKRPDLNVNVKIHIFPRLSKYTKSGESTVKLILFFRPISKLLFEFVIESS